MRIHWTNTAVEHLLAIHEYIAQNSPVYAQRIVDKLTWRSEQIGTFPQSGRIVPEYEIDDMEHCVARDDEQLKKMLVMRLNKYTVTPAIKEAKYFPAALPYG